MASRAEHSFTSQERRMLEAIGQTVGLAVQRATLREGLERANEEVNLYLDIITHDINNANGIAMGYCSLLVRTLSGKENTIVRKVLGGIRQSMEIISNVSTYRSMSTRTSSIEPVPLDPVILAQLTQFSEVDLRYGGTMEVVLADDLLSEVFVNLIGNAVKFGGPDVTVWIEVARNGDEVVVRLADNGPGIPDDQKSEIFNRFVRKSTRASGKGLGLWITRMLLERYGGTIVADDRVAGSPEGGAAMVLTFRRAPEMKEPL